MTAPVPVPQGTPLGAADVKHCAKCGARQFHIATEIMYFSPAGARKMIVWECEVHPLPYNVSEGQDL